MTYNSPGSTPWANFVPNKWGRCCVSPFHISLWASLAARMIASSHTVAPIPHALLITNFLPPLQMLQQVDIHCISDHPFQYMYIQFVPCTLCLVYHWFGGCMKMEAVLWVCVFVYKLLVKVFVTGSRFLIGGNCVWLLDHSVASYPGHSQILSRSRGEKSGEGLGWKLHCTSRTGNGGLGWYKSSPRYVLTESTISGPWRWLIILLWWS